MVHRHRMGGETREVRVTIPGALWIRVRQYAVANSWNRNQVVEYLLRIGLDQVSPPQGDRP